MTDIATRAEQAAPDEARGLLEELILHPRYAGRVDPVIFGLLIGLDTPEAHLAAAMMLTDRGVDIRRTMTGRGVVTFYPKGFTAIGKSATSHAATPALALIAAIARSVE